MSSKEKTHLKLQDLPSDITKSDIELFLSKYKDQINDVSLENIKTPKEERTVAKVSFKENKSAEDCRVNMNLRKIRNSSIRIMWDEKDFHNKNLIKSNLYIRNIPKSKTSREIFEYLNKFGDIYSIKINEDENGNNVGTGYITYYNQEDAKKAIEETNWKKIFDSDLELQYQNQYKNDRNYYYNNHNIHNNNNLKINISNIPNTYTNNDLQKLCEEFGKIQNIKIYNNQHGNNGIITFSNEQEAKNAIDKLNNKEINGKKIIVKEFQYRPHNNNFHKNYFYRPFPKSEEPYENTSLYIKNIPITAKEEDFKKLFEPFGTINSLKLEKETFEKKENGETKSITTNKGFGYISFDNVQNAKKAVEALNNKYIPGYESWTKPLSIEFYIPKQRRQMMENMPQLNMNYIGYQPGMMLPPYPGYPPQYPPMFGMPFNNMWQQGNYKSRGHKQKRGGHRGGYFKNNYQRKNNNNPKNQNNNENNTNYQNTSTNKETKISFDYDTYNKLESDENKKDFLGEILYNSIQNNPLIIEKGHGDDIVGKITGMIIEIPNEKEIIEILENPSALDSRILEALDLLDKKI